MRLILSRGYDMRKNRIEKIFFSIGCKICIVILVMYVTNVCKICFDIIVMNDGAKL